MISGLLGENNERQESYRGCSTRFARLADGATLFDPADESHVKRVTPLQTKQRELQDDPRYRTDLEAGINEVR